MDRRGLLKAGLCGAAAGGWLDGLFPGPAEGGNQERAPGAAVLGTRELIKGLDGMSRAADPNRNPFSDGHNAAAVLASVFFSREQKLDEPIQRQVLSLLEARLLTSPIYEPRPNEPADPALLEGLVKELDAGISTLRSSGHNIIFTNICLKALRAVPEAATPARVAGLRQMVRSFGSRGGGGAREPLVDLADETKFVHFVFEEYLKALDLYLNGKGHHGFAGHVLTVGHSLLELRRAGFAETANKGVQAYGQFVQQARQGADLGGQKVAVGPLQPPTPRDREYWIEQGKRRSGEIVSSHIIKYPYSLFALAKDVRDEALKQRIFEKLYYLTAIS